jgi:hypothetical protein
MYRTWNIPDGTRQHTVRLFYSKVTGKYKIWLNGEKLQEARQWTPTTKPQLIDIAGDRYTLVMLPANPLLLNGETPLLSEEEQQNTSPRQARRRERFLSHWNLTQAVGRDWGLSFVPEMNAAWGYLARYAGWRSHFLVVIQQGALISTRKNGWWLYVRQSGWLSQDRPLTFQNEPRLRHLTGYKFGPIDKDQYWADELSVQLFFPEKKGETPESLKARFQTMLDLVAEYARPMPAEGCENPDCPDRLKTQRQLVFINNFPRLFCPTCVDAIPNQATRMKDEYQQTELEVLPALIVGAGAMCLESLIVDALGLLMGGAMVAMAAVAFLAIYKHMQTYANKYSLLLLSAALVYACLGVGLGSWGSQFLQMLRLGYPMNGFTFYLALQEIINHPGMILATLVFSLIFAAINIWLVRKGEQQVLDGVFKPTVEVIPGEF